VRLNLIHLLIANPLDLNPTLVELITTTEEHLQTANAIIQNATTVVETFKVTKQVVSTLLAPAKDLADLLGVLSDIHPAIGAVATVFKVTHLTILG
jgi:hypothetical protein